MLAIMESSDLVHPRLEHLFTISEETGMDGAYGLTADFVQGRRLINLDTEEFGEFYISCAGGGDTIITLAAERAPADARSATLLLTVGGLRGGHSGVDIHLGRGCANKLLARILSRVSDAVSLRVRSLDGGNQRNSIADSARGLFDVSQDDKGAATAAVEAFAAVLREELAATDPGLEISVVEGTPGAFEPMTKEGSTKVLELVLALPHGILAMSPEMPGLVETSTNMGTLDTVEGTITTVLLTRSAVGSSQVMAQERVRAIASLAGASVEEPRGYPGWKPNPNSDLLRIGKEVYRGIYGDDPEVKAIHAGLECGLFGEKLPGVDMISIGPTMANVHSPDEELYIPHVADFDTLLRAYLEALA
jgi:dipeptidase D